MIERQCESHSEPGRERKREREREGAHACEGSREMDLRMHMAIDKS